MNKCRWCCEDLKDEALVCPHCGRSQNYTIPNHQKWEYCRVFFITHNGNELLFNVNNDYFSFKAGELWEVDRYHDTLKHFLKITDKLDFRQFFEEINDHSNIKMKVVKTLHRFVMDFVGILGELGWEMCGFSSDLGNHVYIFKRPVLRV